MRRGAVVADAVADQGVEVGEAAVLGAGVAPAGSDGITLVGHDVRSARGARVRAGSRVQPGG